MTIKEIRMAAGLTQKQLADLTGISVRTIEAWDNGRRTPPEWLPEILKYYVDGHLKKGI